MEKLDRYFFDVLDRKVMPAEYGTALLKNDKDAALKAAVKYFRERPTPASLLKLNELSYDRETAENAAQGNITVVNIPHRFPEGRIDFLYDPTRATGVYNPEWQWQLNRMYFWNDLALAYLHNGDERFAAAFAQQVRDWIVNVPCPAENWNNPYSAWRTIETGIRLMDSWKIAFEIFRKSPSVPDETLALMVASMCEQAIHAKEHYTRQNWLMMEMNGAYMFAALFPEFILSREIRRFAANLLSIELNKQILPDGWQNELSPDYHYVVFRCAAMMINNARLGGFLAELPPEFSATLERAADAWCKQMTPGFTQPCTNDSFVIDSAVLLREACELFPDRKDFLWGATHGKEGRAPEEKTTSYFFPWAGFAVLRSGWDADASYLNFDVGPLGVCHSHQDKLNINIYKGGEELLFDDGGGQYEKSAFREYGMTGNDHNTILVDGICQYRKGPLAVEQAIDANFVTGEKYDYVCGVYDETYGKELLRPAAHKREILFVKPDIFVVADTMKSMDDKAHDYTMLLHMDTLNVKTSSESVHGILDGKYDLYALLLSENTEVIAESGKESPVSGWYVGRNNRKLHPATTVKIRVEQKRDFRFLTLFFPVEKGKGFPTAEKLSDRDWKITFAGQEYVLDLAELQENLSIRK